MRYSVLLSSLLLHCLSLNKRKKSVEKCDKISRNYRLFHLSDTDTKSIYRIKPISKRANTTQYDTDNIDISDISRYFPIYWVDLLFSHSHCDATARDNIITQQNEAYYACTDIMTKCCPSLCWYNYKLMTKTWQQLNYVLCGFDWYCSFPSCTPIFWVLSHYFCHSFL